nr:immunoglobulin light chain junction region [Mus musculus]
CQHSGELPYTF